MAHMSPALIVIEFIGIVSIVVLFVQTAIDDSRIIFVALTGQLAKFLLTKPGTNGAFLVGTLFALAVIVLMAPIVFRNLRQPRIWAPLLGITAGTVSVAVLYAG